MTAPNPADNYIPDWPAAAERVAKSVEIETALAGWAGTFGFEDDRGDTYSFAVERGQVVAHGPTLERPNAFTVRIPAESWARILASRVNAYMHEAMRGSFRVVGDGYTYVRFTRALWLIADVVREMALEARDGVNAGPATSEDLHPGRAWSVTGHYLPIDESLAYIETSAPAGETQGVVVLLHTAGQSGVQYRRVVPQLTELGYHVVVPDYPGHGRSEPATSGPIDDLAVYADWVLSVIRALDLPNTPLYIVGCSIGGKISLDIAARYGAEIAGAIAMAATAEPGSINRRALTRELEDSASPSRTDRTYLGTLAVVGSSASRSRRELIARMHRREDPLISNSDLLGWGSHDVTEAMPHVSCPVVVVAGRDDLWLDLDAARRTAAAIPRASLVELDGVGHYPPQEMPDFAHRLDQWIRELDSLPIDEATPTQTSPATP